MASWVTLNTGSQPTHTNLYLNSVQHSHPASKHFVLSTLAHRASVIATRGVYQESWNSFVERSNKHAQCWIYTSCSQPTWEGRYTQRGSNIGDLLPSLTSLEAYDLSIHLNCTLAQQGGQFPSPRKVWPCFENNWRIQHSLPVREGLHSTYREFHWDQDLRTPLAHLASSSWQIRRRWTQHTLLCYRIKFGEACILAKKSKPLEHIIKEVIEIDLHPHKMNGEGFSLSRLWKPLGQILMKWRIVLSKDKWLPPSCSELLILCPSPFRACPTATLL